ncbi:hypothetical protein DFP72DRAFT_1102942 [Ephemerocybe angulata]|uniref:Uncharacterized protein n=1 Tax=Ephemerocybe angulata TaxID=980116 RepID=A0A8H6HB39_9AGAR|nr:hypothetical protein DFP72DRAFT_1102942 [Tulosesus angulatus]
MPLATSVRRMCHAPVCLASAFFTATPQSHAIPKRPPLPSPIATPRKLQHTQTPSAKLSKLDQYTNLHQGGHYDELGNLYSIDPSTTTTSQAAALLRNQPDAPRCAVDHTPPDCLARRPIDERGQSSQHLANQTQRLTESNVATTETKAFVIRAFEGVSVSMDSCRPTRGVLTSTATENKGYSSPGSFNKLLQTPLAAHRLRRTPASQPHSPKMAPHAPPNRIAGRRRSGITPTGAGPTLACGMRIATRTVSKRVSDRRNITLTGDRTPGTSAGILPMSRQIPQRIDDIRTKDGASTSATAAPEMGMASDFAACSDGPLPTSRKLGQREFAYSRMMMKPRRRFSNISQSGKGQKHLKSYHATWTSNLNAKQTRTATLSTRRAVDSLVHHPDRTRHAPPVPQLPTVSRPTPSSGLREESAPESLPGPSTTTASILIRGPPEPSQPIQKHNAGKRKRVTIGESGGDGSPTKRARRTCAKCGMGEGCLGCSGVHKCKNACQDCNRMDCPGRSSRNRDKKCTNFVPPEAAGGSV